MITELMVVEVLHAFQFLKLQRVMVILVTKLFTDSDQVAQALNIVRMILNDLLIHLVSLLIGVHASVARGHHEFPLHFSGLQ